MASTSTVNYETLNNIARVLGGEDGVKIMNILNENENITVEEIVNILNENMDINVDEEDLVQINDVRKLLYRFYNHSLITNRRFRDKETGWFIFQWSLQPQLIEAYVNGIKDKILDKLEARLEYEQTYEFYHCNNDTCPNTRFEEAMESVFRCSNCGDPLKRVDNEPNIRFLTEKIKEIKGELDN